MAKDPITRLRDAAENERVRVDLIDLINDALQVRVDT